LNAAAARPLRLTAVEDAVKGKPRNASTGEIGGKIAVQGAEALRFNAYKIPLMRNLVKRAIGGVEEAKWVNRIRDQSWGRTSRFISHFS